MNKQTFISTLMTQCGRDEQSATKSWTYLAETCEWDDASLDRYLREEIDMYEYRPRRRSSNAPMWLAVFAFVISAGVFQLWLAPDILHPLSLGGDARPTATIKAPLIAGNARAPIDAPIDAAAAEAVSLRHYQETVATAAAASGAAPDASCVLITWIDGSQGCTDGRAISAAQSQPGYCVPFLHEDGTRGCTDGHPSGLVEATRAPVAQPTPWPAVPSDGVQWTASAGPNANTCVTVGTQTACSAAGVTLDSDDAAFVARMIEDGKIEKGKGAPHG